MLESRRAKTDSQDIIQIEDEYYIRAASSLADDRTHVLKQGESFTIFDRYGDFQPVGLGEQGFYFEGTRYLSQLDFRLGGVGRPEILHSAVKKDNVIFAVDLTNPDIYENERLVSKRETLHVLRVAFLGNNTCYQRFRLKNFSMEDVEIDFSLRFDADYKDIFEIRGMKRKKTGERLPPEVRQNTVLLSYRGLDEVKRETQLEFSPNPRELTYREAKFKVKFKPQEEVPFFLTITARSDHSTAGVERYQDAYTRSLSDLRASQFHACGIFTSNEQFNDWLNASFIDLHMMMTETQTGPYPYAGVPWFSTAFGRDGIITALEYLWVNPKIARGTLSFLAIMQAKEIDPDNDAEPGKIIHETRKGEMAACGEIPFGKYYGSVDSTPLYVLLAGAYFDQTGDLNFVERLWPSLKLALDWIEQYGDRDGDGFIEYERRSKKGLQQQGWKDSNDSVFYEDGKIAKGPIALCEVQGYVYAALEAASKLTRAFGQNELSQEYRNKSQALKEKFNKEFWCEDIGTFALALDGKKRRCKVRSSNAGHCLWTGIASEKHAGRVVQTLFQEDSFSGWGIRTISTREVRYNPMSYHNGSVWPHDSALIALGLARYGFKEECVRLLASFLDASLFIDQQRMPELFCGFHRREKAGPTPYPVACAPQSWAAASVFPFLRSVLGLEINGPERKVSFSRPTLPEFLHSVRISNLRVGDGKVDLTIERRPKGADIKVLSKDGDIEVVTKP